MLVSEGPRPEFRLAGYLSAVTDKPGFAVPVFRGPSSNRPMVQLISEQDLVAGFRELADGRHVRDHFDDGISIAEGAPALWAFVGGDGRLRVQPREMLVEALKAELQDGTEPFLQLQIAEFCGLEQQFSAKWKAAFRYIGRTSPRSAAAWRDVVIVPEGVRAAVLRAAKTHGLAIDEQDLRRAVTTIVERERLVISLEPTLYEAFSTHPGATKALKAGTLALREAFALRADSLVTAHGAVKHREEIFDHRSRFIAVGDLAVRIARHVISNERSFNGSVRRIGQQEGEEPLVGVVHGSEIELHTGDEWPRLKLHEDGTLLILVGISPGDQQSVYLARHIAEAHRGHRRRIVGVVPHLPGEIGRAHV